MLEGKGAVLATAREVSQLLARSGIAGAVIGGVSVVLHGHVRTTSDVDVYVPEPLADFANCLRSAGYDFDPSRREFLRKQVPVHLIGPGQAVPQPSHFLSIDDVQTVSLADLINLKLHSGTGNVLRSRDLADVIALIQANDLDGRFAGKIRKPLRPQFRKLLQAIRSESRRKPAPPDDPYSHRGF